VDVDVIARVIVAALVNGNDAVVVIDAVDARASISIAALPSSEQLDPSRVELLA
jgi:hypothetical protein